LQGYIYIGLNDVFLQGGYDFIFQTLRCFPGSLNLPDQLQSDLAVWPDLNRRRQFRLPPNPNQKDVLGPDYVAFGIHWRGGRHCLDTRRRLHSAFSFILCLGGYRTEFLLFFWFVSGVRPCRGRLLPESLSKDKNPQNDRALCATPR
jgi:hypothetical protein